MDSVEKLIYGPHFRFSEWPLESVPVVAAGVYRIWNADRFIYVGMAGRWLSAAALRSRTKSTGLYTRLASHASGRRSGDQFCIYVCDRLVLPTLSREDVDEIAAARRSLDSLTRDYIRKHFSFRWMQTLDGQAAQALERHFRKGETIAGSPALNPEPPVSA